MMTSLKAEDIARRLWKMKEEEEEKKRQLSDVSSTGSDMDIENEFNVFKDEEIDENNDDKMDDDATNDAIKASIPKTKPTQSYIALIATAIIKSNSKRLVLSDIYKYIMNKYSYFQGEDKSWRNSIRHNLSLNECFIKVGRSEQGKGHYWAIHPANYEDFAQGDFRRRRARRRVRRSFFDNNSYNNYTKHQYLPTRPTLYQSDYVVYPYSQHRDLYQKKLIESEYYMQRYANISEWKTYGKNVMQSTKTIELRRSSNKEENIISAKKKSSLFTIENILSGKQTKRQKEKEKRILPSPTKQQYCRCKSCDYEGKNMSQSFILPLVY